MSPPGLDRQALAARYEELRRWVLAPDTALAQPRGLALVLQQGLPAWLQVWPAGLRRHYPQPAPHPSAARTRRHHPSPAPGRPW